MSNAVNEAHAEEQSTQLPEQTPNPADPQPATELWTCLCTVESPLDTLKCETCDSRRCTVCTTVNCPLYDESCIACDSPLPWDCKSCTFVNVGAGDGAGMDCSICGASRVGGQSVPLSSSDGLCSQASTEDQAADEHDDDGCTDEEGSETPREEQRSFDLPPVLAGTSWFERTPKPVELHAAAELLCHFPFIVALGSKIFRSLRYVLQEHRIPSEDKEDGGLNDMEMFYGKNWSLFELGHLKPKIFHQPSIIGALEAQIYPDAFVSLLEWGHVDMCHIMVQCGQVGHLQAALVFLGHAACSTSAMIALYHHLVKHGAKVDYEPVDYEMGLPPLILTATVANHHTIPLLKLLLNDGADINMEDRRSHTAMHYAAKTQNAAAVKLLLEHGCDLEVLTRPDYEGFTPIQYAQGNAHDYEDDEAPVQGGSAEVSALLHPDALKEFEFAAAVRENVMAEKKRRAASIISAARDNDAATVALLLREGVPRDQSDDDGRTVLAHAAEAGALSVVEVLLRAPGLDIVNSSCDKENTYPLIVAAAFDHPEIVTRLLQAGAGLQLWTWDEGGTGPKQCPALDAAKNQDSTKVIPILLQAIEKEKEKEDKKRVEKI